MMKDEHIIAECAKCHFRFDILFGVDCPQCRTEAVREAFKPVDLLRTALGMGYTDAVRNLDKVDVTPKGMPEGIRWHGPYYRQYAPAEQAEPLPEDMKMPKGEAAQIYELKRMRKLIGRL
jgi:hypothetical protein